MNIHSALLNFLPGAKERIICDAPMSDYTTFRVGGSADCLFLPADKEEIAGVISYAAEHNFAVTLLGRGSNIVVADQGIRDLTIMIGENFSALECQADTIIAQSGSSLAAIANLAARNSLTGLEFASGIPGALGGGVIMNAGAYDGSLSDVVVWTEYLDKECKLHRAVGSQQKFGYRSSLFSEGGMTVIRSAIRLAAGSREQIISRMAELASRRRQTQPLEKPSAGSAFKRPEGNYAGKLIADCGLKGYQRGGAAVSEKHAGFIVNLGHASAADVLSVFVHVQKTVQDETGIMLEPEVRFVGDWQGKTEQLCGCRCV